MSKTVVIAGGGTGGHLYPAISVAHALKKTDPEIEIHFVGTRLGLDQQIVPKEGFSLHLLPVGAINRASLGEKLRALYLVPLSLLMALKLLFKLQPRFVLGVGGYASAPILFWAGLLRKPCAYWEPNAMPGKANRLLSHVVTVAFTVFDEAKSFLRSQTFFKFGVPVRSTIKKMAKSPSGRFRILIFGGSQGARGINRVFSDAVLKGGDWLRDIEVIHQIGKTDFLEIKKKYESAPESFKPHLTCVEYLHAIHEQYAWADFVICRAGASTISELAACRKATLFVPLPTAADDHQRKNAEALVAKQAALMIPQNEFTVETLVQTVEKVKKDRSILSQLEEKIAYFDSPQAAERMAEKILELSAKKI